MLVSLLLIFELLQHQDWVGVDLPIGLLSAPLLALYKNESKISMDCYRMKGKNDIKECISFLNETPRKNV